MLRIPLILLLLSAPALAAPPARAVVVELFTSEGCNSCPPADALLRELARTRADVLPLAFHVTYWNQLGWPDPFSLQAATQRQSSYNRFSSFGGNYTPQMIVDGHIDVVGSDRPGVAAALKSAAAEIRAAPDLSLSRIGEAVTIAIGAGTGAGKIWLVGYDREHRTEVPRGENAGATLVEANIVRDFITIGDWAGAALTLHHAMPKGERIAVLIQSADGRFVAVGREGET